jgi:hypothetical protein
MTRRMAREILMKRGRRHYPDEDYETVIQSMMDDYDPESHFDEQMEDFLRNHPEYSVWRMLFIGEGREGEQDWRKERRAWLEAEGSEEARRILEDLIIVDDWAPEAIASAVRHLQVRYNFNGLKCLRG